jgi:2-dehydropantoate 2-reductase
MTNMNQLRIGVVGVGGAGGYFACRWAESGHHVVAIARGAHRESIERDGLRVRSPLGDARARIEVASDMAALEGTEVVVFATKTWQLPVALESAIAYISPDAVVFGLQNGVESPRLLAEVHPAENAWGGTCRIISYIEEPGVIRHVGAHPTITLGEPSGGLTKRGVGLQDRLDVPACASVVASDDITRDLWKKLLFFAPVSGLGSISRSTIGAFRSVPESRTLLKAAISETANVGRALGVDLGSEVEGDALRFIDGLPAEATSSMQRDFDAGRRTELEALSGFVSRTGTQVGVATPTHDAIYGALLPMELAARG